MASNPDDIPIYLHNGVVVFTKKPTDRGKLGNFLKANIRDGNFLEKTEFHILCGFHTNKNGEPSKSDRDLFLQFSDMREDLLTENDKVQHMRYKIHPLTDLKTEETGMHILTLRLFNKSELFLYGSYSLI